MAKRKRSETQTNMANTSSKTKASTPTKRGAGASKSKEAPTSALKSGKVKGQTSLKAKKKDSRNVLFIEAVVNGILTFWTKKGNKEEEAFTPHDWDMMKNNAEVAERLGVNDVTHRRGEDGDTAMKQSPSSDYSWRMGVMILGEDACNSPERRKEAIGKVIAYFNENATTENYTWPKKMRFGGDLTTQPMKKADEVLLDEDVVGLMLAAYPTTELVELSEFDDIMSSFWSNTEDGKAALEAQMDEADDNN